MFEIKLQILLKYKFHGIRKLYYDLALLRKLMKLDVIYEYMESEECTQLV
jgi:hypothetical protein